MTQTRITGCTACAGHQRPGYVREWIADPHSPNGARWQWQRCPDECTADSRRARINEELTARGLPAFTTPGAPADVLAADGARNRTVKPPVAAPAPAPAPSPADPAHAAAAPATAPTEARTAPALKRPALVAAVCLDAGRAGTVTADVPGIGMPGAATLPALFAWIASGPALGIAPVHDDGRRHNGTIVLTPKLCKALGLPKTLPADTKGQRALSKTLRTAADAAGIDLGEKIAGRMAAVPRKVPGVRRAYGVKVIITPWLGQTEGPGQAAEAHLTHLGGGDAPALARRLRLMAEDLGVPLTSTPAVTARELLEAVRPRERWSENRDATRVPRDGAMPAGDHCVPVAAGRDHPLTHAALEAGETICRENDLGRWHRPLTPGEAEQPWAVEIDVSAAHLSVTESLPLPSGPLQHTTAPRFDKRTAGVWWCDFTGTRLQAAHVPEALRAEAGRMLPHPATPDGHEPTEPGWYATPTVAYMVEAYGFDPATITQAYTSTHTVPLLTQWTARLRTAYKTRLAALGLTDGMSPDAFLTAHAARSERAAADPDAADAYALTELYKSVYRGATGMWTTNALSRTGESIPDRDERWLNEVVTSWHYRPEIRFTIVAASRTAMHRRITKTYALTGRAPFAVNVDGLLYACETPGPLPLIPLSADGKQVPGALRLGSAPGSCKHDATLPMAAVREALEAGEPLQGAYGIAPRYDIHGQRADTPQE
ncbi:hypothetical protein ABZ845_30780 [Streptomyces sp. NPDC047022]|uniref:hypothetical protein n=1 Tax=Streptomyces sp. NPDC047022 TaxID=3155737 RepID=UPI0033CFF9C4